MEEVNIKNQKHVLVHYKINFKYVCLCTVSIPLGALIVCFISAYIFQYDDIHETHCRVCIFLDYSKGLFMFVL